MNIDVPGLFCYFQKLLSCDAKNLVFVSIQYTYTKQVQENVTWDNFNLVT